ncbi:hypothetical protein HDU93_002557, partial [Gonapodya sp. JEL0774]
MPPIPHVRRPLPPRKSTSARSPVRDFGAQVSVPSNQLAAGAIVQADGTTQSVTPIQNQQLPAENETLLEALKLRIQALQQRAARENTAGREANEERHAVSNAGTQAGESTIKKTVEESGVSPTRGTAWNPETEYRQNFRNLAELVLKDEGSGQAIPLKKLKAAVVSSKPPAGARSAPRDHAKGTFRDEAGDAGNLLGQPSWWGHETYTPSPSAIRGAALQFLKDRERKLNAAIEAPAPEKSPFADRVPPLPGEKYIGSAGERVRVQAARTSWNGDWGASPPRDASATAGQESQVPATEQPDLPEHPVVEGSATVERGRSAVHDIVDKWPFRIPLQPAVRSRSVDPPVVRRPKPKPSPAADAGPIPFVRYEGGVPVGYGTDSWSTPKRLVDENTQTVGGAFIDRVADLGERPVGLYDARGHYRGPRNARTPSPTHGSRPR